MIKLTDNQLRALPESELRRLQGEYPPATSDSSNPNNEFPWAIWAEGQRRGLW
jgi:hypothetical protein